MANVDKLIEEKGYKVARTEYFDGWLDGAFKRPIIFIEYIKDTRETFWADNDPVELGAKIIVDIVIDHIDIPEYRIRVNYEGYHPSLGGGREYGTIISSCPSSDMQLFVKKTKQLSRQYKRLTRIHKLFGRG